MPTPVGHSLAGAIICVISTKGRHLLESWKWLVVCILFATLPDVDFIPALFGRLDIANRVHRHITHTLLFAILISAAVLGVLKILRKPRAVRNSAFLLLCWASHIFLDMLGKDFRPPIGIPFLWPFLRKSFKFAVEVFPDLKKDTYAELFSLHNLRAVGHEVMVFGAILVILILLKLRLGTNMGRAEKGKSVAGAAPDTTE